MGRINLIFIRTLTQTDFFNWMRKKKPFDLQLLNFLFQ